MAYLDEFLLEEEEKNRKRKEMRIKQRKEIRREQLKEVVIAGFAITLLIVFSCCWFSGYYASFDAHVPDGYSVRYETYLTEPGDNIHTIVDSFLETHPETNQYIGKKLVMVKVMDCNQFYDCDYIQVGKEVKLPYIEKKR